MKMDFEDCWLSRKNLGLQSVNSKKKKSTISNPPDFNVKLLGLLENASILNEMAPNFIFLFTDSYLRRCMWA